MQCGLRFLQKPDQCKALDLHIRMFPGILLVFVNKVRFLIVYMGESLKHSDMAHQTQL